MPELNLTAAAALARPLGMTIRREGDSEIAVYRKGEGKTAPHAYFTDCPVDALATAAAIAEHTAPADALAAARAACGLPCETVTADDGEARKTKRKAARDAGHDAETLADDTTRDAAERARLYETAAEHFETLGAGHYAARAAVCREAAKRLRPATVNLTPTWAGLMPAFFAVMENGTGEGKAIARDELNRLASGMDSANAARRETETTKQALAVLLSTVVFDADTATPRLNTALDADDIAASLAAMAGMIETL